MAMNEIAANMQIQKRICQCGDEDEEGILPGDVGEGTVQPPHDVGEVVLLQGQEDRLDGSERESDDCTCEDVVGGGTSCSLCDRKGDSEGDKTSGDGCHRDDVIAEIAEGGDGYTHHHDGDSEASRTGGYTGDVRID